MEYGPALVIGISGLIVYMIYDTYYMGTLIPVTSTIDNNTYYVRDLPDSQAAADLIAQIRKHVETLIRHLEKIAQSDERTANTVKNFNGDHFAEAPANNANTSYSINKGEKIVLCLRSKDLEKKLVDLNTMMFVTLHEIAHLATNSIGHTDEFWTNFKWILEESVNIGIYRHVDYATKPKEYCGMNIVSNPLDNKTKST